MYPIGKLQQDSGEYLSALRGVRSLELHHITFDPISQEDFNNCFSAFRETLRDLTLKNFSTSFSTFVTLVGYFPNITTLKLGMFTVRPDEGPVPPLSRPLRGKICVGFTRFGCIEFFNRFAKLGLEYEELVVSSRIQGPLAESVFKLSANTVKCLRLRAEPRERLDDNLSTYLNRNPCFLGEPVALRFSHFQQLQKLQLRLPTSGSKILSSITSTELREVVILAGKIGDWWSSPRMELGAPADDQLCELVDRLQRMGYRHTLEAKLRFKLAEDDVSGIDPTAFLPRFREKGVVTIVDDARDRILHSSARSL